MKKIFAVALACLMLCSTFMLASCGITEHSPDGVIDKLPMGGIESDLVIDKNPDGGKVDDGNVDDGKPDNGNPDDGDPNGVHEHEFNLELIFEEFLVSPATCTEKAVYYKSCKCKEKSEETFEWGCPLFFTDLTNLWCLPAHKYHCAKSAVMHETISFHQSL